RHHHRGHPRRGRRRQGTEGIPAGPDGDRRSRPYQRDATGLQHRGEADAKPLADIADGVCCGPAVPRQPSSADVSAPRGSGGRTTRGDRVQEHESFAETSPTALPVLFIGGIGRSGTTVFELSLGTDERVVPLGEVVHLWQRSLIDDEPCGCGEPFSQCSFWTEVGARAFGGWDRVNAERVLTLRHRIDRTVRTPQLAARVGGSAWHADVREYASYYSRIYRAAVEVSGSSVVVDSSKQASLPYVL